MKEILQAQAELSISISEGKSFPSNKFCVEFRSIQNFLDVLLVETILTYKGVRFEFERTSDEITITISPNDSCSIILCLTDIKEYETDSINYFKKDELLKLMQSLESFLRDKVEEESFKDFYAEKVIKIECILDKVGSKAIRLGEIILKKPLPLNTFFQAKLDHFSIIRTLDGEIIIETPQTIFTESDTSEREAFCASPGYTLGTLQWLFTTNQPISNDEIDIGEAFYKIWNLHI